MHHAVDALEEKPVVVAIDLGGGSRLHELSPFRTGHGEGRLDELLDWMERRLMPKLALTQALDPRHRSSR